MNCKNNQNRFDDIKITDTIHPNLKFKKNTENNNKEQAKRYLMLNTKIGQKAGYFINNKNHSIYITNTNINKIIEYTQYALEFLPQGQSIKYYYFNHNYVIITVAENFTKHSESKKTHCRRYIQTIHDIKSYQLRANACRHKECNWQIEDVNIK
ncbi:hypothetical protein [Rickettsia endosymbiont of Cardiosporidium cionae]|uniref:hypothetical protein n=1 Tax=Rickettsia endosymbiont of Cardiosporidium cionae TaxID=2777155 RepID=UPI001893A3AA|nr:hypothetical protein [Rickettsia endosymbiont of Cardiosporidium cionae]